MRYVELMSGQKPYLLAHIANNMGSETIVDYAPSTRFYVEDRLAGRPWITRLPFPVHVVARIESRDLVSNTTLVSTYRYRHGYYDGVEREYPRVRLRRTDATSSWWSAISTCRQSSAKPGSTTALSWRKARSRPISRIRPTRSFSPATRRRPSCRIRTCPPA